MGYPVTLGDYAGDHERRRAGGNYTTGDHWGVQERVPHLQEYVHGRCNGQCGCAAGSVAKAHKTQSNQVWPCLGVFAFKGLPGGDTVHRGRSLIRHSTSPPLSLREMATDGEGSGLSQVMSDIAIGAPAVVQVSAPPGLPPPDAPSFSQPRRPDQHVASVPDRLLREWLDDELLRHFDLAYAPVAV